MEVQFESAFETKLVDIGTVYVGREIKVSFPYKPGTTIHTITTSCHCSNALDRRKEHAIEVTFTAQNIPEHLIRMGQQYQDVAKRVQVSYVHKDSKEIISEDLIFTAKVKKP
jgi:hypothetical protein